MRAGHARPLRWWMVEWVLAERGGRHICRPYGVNRQVSYNRKRHGRDESLPYGLCELEIVGRPDLRLSRACMGVGMVSGHPCRERRPRRPAEGSRPLPTMQNSNGRRRKVAGRACPAPTGWWMVGGCWPGVLQYPYSKQTSFCIPRGAPAPLSFFVVSCYNVLCIVMYKIYRERYLFITHAAFEKL